MVRGTANLLRSWKAFCPKARFIYLSTDAVFDGLYGPYKERDIPRPIWAYGRAKRQAEVDVLGAGGMVVRSSLVYGLNPLDKRTAALETGLQNGDFGYPYFDDEIRCPVHVEDLCRELVVLSQVGDIEPRILHIAGPETMSRFDFAVRLAERMGYSPKMIPKASSSETEFLRPKDLTMDTSLAQKKLKVKMRSLTEIGHNQTTVSQSVARKLTR